MPLTDAQAQLVADNLALAYWFASRYARRMTGLLEEFQDAAIDGLMDAARAYDGARGKAFSTLAAIAIRHRMIYRVKYLKRACRQPELPVSSLDHAYSGEHHPAIDGRELADPALCFERLIAPLDPREKVIMRGRFRDGKKLRELGAELGITREWVRKIEQRALRKLANAFDEDGLPRAKMPAPFSPQTPEIRPSGASRPAENARAGRAWISDASMGAGDLPHRDRRGSARPPAAPTNLGLPDD